MKIVGTISFEYDVDPIVYPDASADQIADQESVIDPKDLIDGAVVTDVHLEAVNG